MRSGGKTMASALLREPEQTTVSVQEERIGDYVLDRLGQIGRAHV